MNRNQVLRQRSLTGIIFAVIVIALLTSGVTGAFIFGALIMIACTYEYVRMIFPRNIQKLTITMTAVVAVAAGIIFVSPSTEAYLYICLTSCLFLILGILSLFIPFIQHRKYYVVTAMSYFGLPLGLFLSFIIHRDVYLPYFWMTVILMIWMSDSFAYLVGSRIGKTKLFERISPKKSWEGFLGAGIITLPLAYFIGTHFFFSPADMYGISTAQVMSPGIFWVMIAAISWMIGTLGDLVESSIKRTFEVKDSGKLLPGHGGILDRFDSFIYILPFVLFLLVFFSKQ
ncbi:MAG: phosphatidate cytidylyltransferase [Saprospiraceae bacterium]